MHWAVAGPSFRPDSSHAWLAPYVPGGHRFTIVPRAAPLRRKSWHALKLPVTGAGEWRALWRQAGHAVERRDGGGVITIFPPLAAMAGLRQRRLKQRIPIIAYCFNMGALYTGPRGAAARYCLANVDRFVVHARRERELYAGWLGLPVERFEFIHFQRATIPRTRDEETTDPFVVAMGSANRDYGCLFEAVRKLKIRTIVVAAEHAVRGLEVPPNVELRTGGVSYGECLALAQAARVNVVPLRATRVGSGQVTFVDAMRLGRPVVASDVIGTEDYVTHDRTGLLVSPSDPVALSSALDRLWTDAALRDRIAEGARTFADAHLSDEAAGVALGRVLDDVGA